jgi:hypothetical protein
LFCFYLQLLINDLYRKIDTLYASILSKIDASESEKDIEIGAEVLA